MYILKWFKNIFCKKKVVSVEARVEEVKQEDVARRLHRNRRRTDYTKVELFENYTKLWLSLEFKRFYGIEAVVAICHKNKKRYKEVGDRAGFPWYLVAIIHSLESRNNFERGLHNGEAWNKKTTKVPKGLGPFKSWEDSAVNALGLVDAPEDFTHIEDILHFLEKYNGTGYRKRGINSPYLWSYSNHYTSGKYIRDGKYDPNAVSKQIGAAILLKELKED